MPPGSHSSGSRRSPAVIAFIVVALIAVAGVAFFLLKGKGGGGAKSGGSHEISAQTPDFSFQVRKVTVVPTVSGHKVSKAQSDALAKGIAAELSRYYQAAYLDPNNWSKNDYSSVWSFFDPSASSAAKADQASLTLGDGSQYQTVEPKPGTTSVKILMGNGGKPDTANAQITFGVLATDKSGQQTTFASLGQFFLRPSGKDWLIYGYKIVPSSEPGDQIVGSPPPSPKKPKQSPAASPS